MDKLQMLRLSESLEEDAVDEFELLDELNTEDAKSFKEKYKEFYSDIKINAKEDW